MGYNISDVGGEVSGGVDVWTFTLDLTDPSATTVSGDFDVVSLVSGDSTGEATDGYTFSALSDPTLGTLTFNQTDGTWTFTVDRAAVIATGQDQVISFTVTGTSGSNTDTDTINITILICVARGTLIDTPQGPVPVEALTPGDLVTTLDGPPQPLRWIGARRVDAAELARDPSLRPIRIGAGALGPGVPARDLVVSPQHRVYLQDWRAELFFGTGQVLVPAKSLVNDSRISVDRAAEEVEYFHVLFDTHQIMFTEGAATESFHPGTYSVSALDRATRNELDRLFPGLSGGQYGDTARPSLRVWEARMLCAMGRTSDEIGAAA